MSIFSIITALGRGVVRAEHDDHPTSSGPAAESAPAASSGAPSPAVTTAAPTSAISALDALIEKAKRNAIVVPSESAAPIRKMGNDFSMVLGEWGREAIMIEADKYGGDGVYAMSKDVADAFVRGRRQKMIFGGMLFLCVDSDSNPFLTYAKVNGSRAATTYLDAVKAATRNWTWVQWVGGRDGYYDFGHPPEDKPKAPPVWPDDRTPDQICDAVFANGRYIGSPDHWLVQRILTGS